MKADESEVIAALLNWMATQGATGKRHILEPNTALASRAFPELEPDPAVAIKHRLGEASNAAIEDFLRVGKQSVPLNVPKHLVRPEMRYDLANESRLSKFSWEAFYQDFPDSSGLWSFSRVGFNAKGDEALLYLSHTCGPLCGQGMLVLLRTEWTVWRVVRVEQVWVS